VTEDLRRLTAYHEAGHVVAHWALGIPFRYVTIRPRTGFGVWGSLRTYGIPQGVRKRLDVREPRPRDLAQVEAHIVASLAGLAAEYRLLGIGHGPEYEAEARDYADQCYSLALLLSYPQALPAEGARAYRDGLWLRSKGLVADRWPAVEAVAMALLERGTLGAKDVARLAREVGPSGA